MSPAPTIGRIVLFQNWRRLEAPAMVVAIEPKTGNPHLQVFHADGTLQYQTNVASWQATSGEIEASRKAWTDWDDYCDAQRAAQASIEGASPQTPQSSWRWPPRAEDLGLKPATQTAAEALGKTTSPLGGEMMLTRSESIAAAAAAGAQWFADGKTLDDTVPSAVIPDAAHEQAFADAFEAARTAAAASADQAGQVANPHGQGSDTAQTDPA
jgi:hypothetical protein